MEQRLSLVTLGVADLARSRRFYEEGLGWKASGASTEEVAFFQLGGIALALWGREALAETLGCPPRVPAAPSAASRSRTTSAPVRRSTPSWPAPARRAAAS